MLQNTGYTIQRHTIEHGLRLLHMQKCQMEVSTVQDLVMDCFEESVIGDAVCEQ